MNKALALLEYHSVAAGVLAVDRMLKKSPIALLRCGTVHPGRYLALVGGSVAATAEAHAQGVALGRENGSLVAEVCLPDPHEQLVTALDGRIQAPESDTVGVLEIATSPNMLATIDRILKSVPVSLTELRLADDLGGRTVAVIAGELSDVKEALDMVGDNATELLGATLLPRVDQTLRQVLGQGTRFATCPSWAPDGAEILED